MFCFFVLQCFVLVLPVLIPLSYGLISAVDSTDAITKVDYSAVLKGGFTRAIIRGYDSACTSGGEVNPNFVTAYQNAVAAGYTDIHTYWLPCNGMVITAGRLASNSPSFRQRFLKMRWRLGWFGLIWNTIRIATIYVRIQVHEPRIWSIFLPVYAVRTARGGKVTTWSKNIKNTLPPTKCKGGGGAKSIKKYPSPREIWGWGGSGPCHVLGVVSVGHPRPPLSSLSLLPCSGHECCCSYGHSRFVSLSLCCCCRQ